MSGVLYGIGVGPGDPELITLKGYRILQSVRHVFVTARGSRPSLAYRIAERYLDPGRQQVRCLPFPAGGGLNGMDARWDEHAATIAGVLHSGDDAAFLTEGDPLFYGSFNHVLLRLARLQPAPRVVVVPGITSVAASAALLGKPLTVRDEALAVLPAAAPAEQLRATLAGFATVVILKPGEAMARLLDLLAASGRLEQAVLVQRCGQDGEAVVSNVAALRHEPVDYFSLLIVRGGEA